MVTPFFTNSAAATASKHKVQQNVALRAVKDKHDCGLLLHWAREAPVSEMSDEFWSLAAIGALCGVPDRQTDFVLLEKAAHRTPLKDIRIPKQLERGVFGNVGGTLLGSAAQRNASKDVLLFLLAEGCDAHVADIHGMTPLMHAVRFARQGMDNARELASRSNLDAQDSEGRTALMHAAAMLFWSPAIMLIDAGANPNLLDQYGNTLLVQAIKNIDSRDGPNDEEIDAIARFGGVCDWQAANAQGEDAFDVVEHMALWAALDEIATGKGVEAIEWAQKRILQKMLPKARVISAANEEAKILRQSMERAELALLRTAQQKDPAATRRDTPRL